MKNTPKKRPVSDHSAERCTFTLPAQLYRDLCAVSMALGISRSALLVNVLGDTIHDMAVDLADFEAEGGGPGVVRRLRGQSIAKVESAYRDFITSQAHDGLETKQ